MAVPWWALALVLVIAAIAVYSINSAITRLTARNEQLHREIEQIKAGDPAPTPEEEEEEQPEQPSPGGTSAA